METKENRMLLWLTLGGFFMMGVSFLLMMPHPKLNGPTVRLLAGILFWLSLVTGITCQSILSRRRRAWERKNHKKSDWKKVGLFCFWQNRAAAVADVLMAVSMMAFIISLAVTNASGYACYVFLGLFVAAFASHCIFNGKNFRYVFSK